MKRESKNEWFVFDKPLGEPEIDYRDEEYYIERIVRKDETILWMGLNTNWVKERRSGWKKLAPGGEFVACGEPIYETMYKDLNYHKA